MPPLPQPARPGDLITAEAWNSLLERVADLERRLDAIETPPTLTFPTFTLPTLTVTQPTLTFPTFTLTLTQPTFTIPTQPTFTLTLTQPTFTIPTQPTFTLTLTQPTLTFPTFTAPTLPTGPIFTIPGPEIPDGGAGPIVQPVGVMIPGIGRAEAELLRNANLDRIEALAAATPETLSGVLNIGREEADAMIRNARSLIG